MTIERIRGRGSNGVNKWKNKRKDYLLTYFVALVRKRTTPIERPPLVGEVNSNFSGYRVPRGQRDGSLRPYFRISRPNLLCKSYR
jgi:hypothetical protein